MDAKVELKKYIAPAQATKIAAWVLLAIAIIALVIGVLMINRDDTPNATQFDPNSSRVNSYAYLDIVSVSDWVVQYGDGESYYYTAYADDGLPYMVSIPKAQYQEMTAARNYYAKANPGDPYPEAYRLYGLVMEPSNQLVEAYAGYYDLTNQGYFDIFGLTFLNGQTSPSGSIGAVVLIVAFLSGIFSLVVFYTMFKPLRSLKKNMDYYAGLGETEHMANEFVDQQNEIVGRNQARLSNSYLFGKGNGVAVRYSDIQWAYPHKLRGSGFTTSSLIIYTPVLKEQVVFKIQGEDNSGLIQNVLNVISQRNPAAVIGYSAENAKAFKK